MKISIIGTNGFLSTAIATFANSRDWELDMYGLHEPQGHTYNNFFQINLIESEIDYSNIIKSDIIIYASGAGIQANLNESTELIYSLNVTVPVSICNALKKCDYKGCVVTFGSVFEMGESGSRKPFTESEILSSINSIPNDYAISKRMLSQFVFSYKHKFIHWHFIIPTIYGQGENSKRLIPYVINAIKQHETLHFTSGDQIRQYVHVSEIPRLIEIAYEKNLPSGIFNIEGKDTCTVKQIVDLIHKKFEATVPYDCFGKVQREDVGMKYLALNGAKLNNQIGFSAEISISEALIEYL